MAVFLIHYENRFKLSRMKKIVSMLVVMAFVFGGMTEVQAQSSKKEVRKEKREERLMRDSIMGAGAFQTAVQAIEGQSFVLQANSIQPLNGRLFFVNSNTNYVSMNNGQATVQVASNSPYPGPNGLGGITVQGSVSNLQVEQEKNGNVYVTFSVQGVFISATVSMVLYNGSNNATVTVDPNFSGNDLTMTGSLVPYSESNVFQGTTY